MLVWQHISFAQTGIQDYDIFTTRSGLTHNSVLTMAQDSQGYLWIGTRNGLNRYDGQEFISYADMFGTFGNAFGNAVDAICCYRHEVWIGTRGGLLAWLDNRTGKWQKIALPPPTHLSYFGIKSIYVSDTVVLVGCIDGTLLLVNRNTQSAIKTYTFAQSIKHIFPLGDSLVIYADSFYLYHSQGRMDILRFNGLLPDWPASAINAPVAFTDYGGGHYGFYNLITGKQRSIVVSSHNYAVPHTMRTSGDHFLSTDGHVIYEYDKSGNILNTFNVNEKEKNDHWELINDILKDREGNIWIAIDHGLVRVITSNRRFRRFTRDSHFNRISHNYIRSLYAKENTVWAGTWHGSVNAIECLQQPGTYRIREYRFAPYSPIQTTNTILQLRNGTILAGSNLGLYMLRGKTFVPYTFSGSFKEVSMNTEVWSIIEDRYGTIWVASRLVDYCWITLIDPIKRTTRVIPYPALVWNIIEDRKGQIWFATEKGLVMAHHNRETDQLTSLHQNTFAANKPEGNRMWNIVEDSLSNLWIGTTDNGLLYYNTRTKHFTSYTGKIRLPNNTICGLLITDNRRLWISTMNGLSVMDLYSKKVTSYSEEDGLTSNDFNFKVCAATQHGELFWGTKNGIVSFHKDSINPVAIRSPLVITNASIMGKPVRTTDTISVSYTENMISITFALLEFAHHRHYYRYRLNGFSGIWSMSDERNPVATYTNLPPGTYQLEVNAAINMNEWLPITRTVTIIVKPAFWQTGWFIILVTLFVAGALALIIYLRIQHIVSVEREKHVVKQKIASLELSALQAQMNPHFIFNAIHSIQHFIFKNDELNANEYLTKFANLMRLFLESSKRKFISLSEEIEILKLYTDLEKLRFEEQFDIHIHVDEQIDTHKTEIPSMLLQPFIENAIIHGLIYRKKEGLLSIRFARQQDGILCTVDDNGIGRIQSMNAKASGHKSRGMELIMDRIRSYNELNGSQLCDIRTTDKTDGAGNALGTRVDIFIYVS